MKNLQCPNDILYRTEYYNDFIIVLSTIMKIDAKMKKKIKKNSSKNILHKNGRNTKYCMKFGSSTIIMVLAVSIIGRGVSQV